MKRLLVAGLVTALLIAIIPQAQAQRWGSVSFKYNIQSRGEQMQSHDISFLEAHFLPDQNSLYDGTVYFKVGIRGVCNIKILGKQGNYSYSELDTSPIGDGVEPMYLQGLNRGGYQQFVLYKFGLQFSDCSGNVIAKGRFAFYTPPQKIVTEEQWEKIDIKMRTLIVEYRQT